MMFAPARAYGAAAVACGAALIFYSLTAAFVPVWPSHEPATMAGVGLIDILGGMPFGQPEARPTIVAIVMSAMATALIAWTIVRQRYGAMVAVGCALTIAFGGSVWREATSDAPGSVAGALVTAAVALALADGLSRYRRAMAATVCLALASTLEPAILAATPGLLAHAVRLSTRVIVVAVASGLGIGVLLPTTTAPDWRNVLMMLREEWPLPGVVIMVSGSIGSLWRAPHPLVIVMAATALVCLLLAVGHDIAPLGVFPAILLAHGLQMLSANAPRIAGSIAFALALLGAVDRWQSPAPHTWRVLAWRDALERVLSPESSIHTGIRAARALNAPLFAGRSSRIQIAQAALPLAGPSVPIIALDDLREELGAAGHVLEPVTLTYVGAADLLTRLPEGTIVGLAVSSAAVLEDPQAVAATLAVIRRSAAPDGPVVAVGVVGHANADLPTPRTLADSPLKGLPVSQHTLIGDLIEGTDQRSPADFEVRASVTEVSVRLEGREIRRGTGWAVIAIDRGGPFIDAFASDVGGTGWPIEIEGLRLWSSGVGRVSK